MVPLERSPMKSQTPAERSFADDEANEEGAGRV